MYLFNLGVKGLKSLSHRYFQTSSIKKQEYNGFMCSSLVYHFDVVFDGIFRESAQVSEQSDRYIGIDLFVIIIYL